MHRSTCNVTRRREIGAIGRDKGRSGWIRYLAAALIAMGLAGCGGSSERDVADAADPVIATATRGDLTIIVSGYGQIESKKSHKIIPELRSHAVVSYLVEDGKRVTNGEVVARLTSDEVMKRIEALEIQIDEKVGVLDSRRTELDVERIDNTTKLKNATLELRKSKQELEQFLEGDRPIKRRNASLRIKEAEGDLTRGKKRYEDLKGLLKEGFITEDEVEEQQLNIEVHEINLETANIEKRILEAYNLPLDLAFAESAVESAKTELEKTQKVNQMNLRSRERAVNTASQTLARAAFDLTKARGELAAFVITAPSEGVVQYGDAVRPWRRTEIHVGMTVSRGQVLMSIPDVANLDVGINVPEVDIRRVRTGQVARVTVDAMPGRTFEARVVKVAEVANAGHWISSDVKEFKVDLSLTRDPAHKPGFSCRAEIVTRVIADAVQIPVQAVFREDDEYYVYRVIRRSHERQIVKLGGASETHAQIKDGLSEGDKVYLGIPPGEGAVP